MIKLLIIFYFFIKISFSYENVNFSDNINITSDMSEIIINENKMIFTKNVTSKHKNFILKSDTMTINYVNTNDKKEIQNILVNGNVNFSNNKFFATSEEAIYDTIKNTIIFKNNVKITENNFTLYAEKFEYDINTKKSTIIGNKKKERISIILN